MAKRRSYAVSMWRETPNLLLDRITGPAFFLEQSVGFALTEIKVALQEKF
jgi:hypothetical protein